MREYLLDTNVLSEFSRSAAPPNPTVKRWMEAARPDTLFISVLSFGEIRKGIRLLPGSKRRDALERWLDVDLNQWFGKKLLPITQFIANRWGILAAQSQQQGRPLDNIDGLLAATALEQELVIATCNTRHFEGLGAAGFNP